VIHGDVKNGCADEFFGRDKFHIVFLHRLKACATELFMWHRPSACALSA
jgi:hypothetical protein